MDGYAFCHTAHPGQSEIALQVAGQSLAGHPFTGTLQPHQAVRIMTGAVVPETCDTVVVQEVVSTEGEDRVRFDLTGITPGQFVRGIGDDLTQGEIVLRAGTRLGPAQLGVIASIGIDSVVVTRTPRVAILSTGDELRSPGETLTAGQIYDSNRTTLSALVRTHHAEPVTIGQVPDTPDAIHQALDEAASRSDLILSSGGVSVGVADHMRSVLEREGTLQFWKIAVKPGRPLVFGQWKNAWYFGLPGNPVSAMVTFDQIVRPALALIEGETKPEPVQLTATSHSSLKKLPGRMEFQRGRLFNDETGNLCVLSTGSQDSHVLSSLRDANCLIALPLHSEGAEIGDQLHVIPLDPLWGVPA